MDSLSNRETTDRDNDNLETMNILQPNNKFNSIVSKTKDYVH